LINFVLRWSLSGFGVQANSHDRDNRYGEDSIEVHGRKRGKRKQTLHGIIGYGEDTPELTVVFHLFYQIPRQS